MMAAMINKTQQQKLLSSYDRLAQAVRLRLLVHYRLESTHWVSLAREPWLQALHSATAAGSAGPKPSIGRQL